MAQDDLTKCKTDGCDSTMFAEVEGTRREVEKTDVVDRAWQGSRDGGRTLSIRADRTCGNGHTHQYRWVERR